MTDIDWTFIASKLPVKESLIRKGSSYREVPPREVGTPFRGSQLKDMCPRQEALCAIHEVWREDEISPDLQMIFDIGTGIHETFQQSLLSDWIVGSWRCRGCGAEYGSMTKLRAQPKKCDGKKYNHETDELEKCPNHNYHEDVVDDWHLPGFDYKEIDLSFDDPVLYSHPDGLLWRGDGDPPDFVAVDNPYLEALEIKSASERAIEYGYSGTPPIKNEPCPHHRDQLMLYMYVLGIKFGRILYYNKSSFGIRSSIIEHTITLDEDYVEDEILNDPRLVEESIRERDPSIAPKVCSSDNCAKARACPVSDICWGGDDA